MLKVSESALEIIRDYLRQQKIDSFIRVGVMSGSCAGPNLKISVDDSKKNDRIFNYGKIRFIVNKKLLETCNTISIDYNKKSRHCICSGGCGGLFITGEKKFLFNERCNGSGRGAETCECDCII